MMEVKFPFELGAKVHIDGDASIVGTLTAVTFRDAGFMQYEVCWLHNGDAKSAFIDLPRLTVIP